MPEYSEDEIEERVILSCDMFYIIEERLNDFLDFVPLDFNHLDVYSLKLVSIILEAGSEILSLFDLAVSVARNRCRLADSSIVKDSETLWKKEETLKSRRRSLTFSDYYRFFDRRSIPELKKAIIVIGDFAYLVPFEESSPQWWKTYNLLKHDKYTNLQTATMKAALNICGAEFLLVYQNQTFAGFKSNLFDIHDWGSLPSSLKKL